MSDATSMEHGAETPRTNADVSEADPRVAELVTEVRSLREANDSLRGELTRTQSALTNLRARYQQLLEELHLIKRRLVIAKAERMDDVAAAAQLAFNEVLAETQAIEQVLDAIGDAGNTEPCESTQEHENSDKNKNGARPKQKKNGQSETPPSGRRNLAKLELPVVRVELPDPELEGKAERIGVEEHSRVGYERGGYRRIVLARIVYKVSDDAAQNESNPSSGSTTREDRIAAPSVSDGLNRDDGRTTTPKRQPSEAAVAPATFRFVAAPMPREIMPRGMLAPSMIARMLAMKYMLGVPFYRYEQSCASEGFSLDRATMSRYAEHVGATLGCICEAARKEAIETAFCLSTDATGIAIQPTPLDSGKRQPCRKGHFFVTLADKDHVFFDFQPKHTSLTVWNMFKGFSGYVQADAHVIYDALFKGIAPEGAEDRHDNGKAPPIEVGCLAHARRKYWEAAVCNHPLGIEGVRLIDAIFAADQKLASLSPAQRKARRDEAVRPLVDKFFDWVHSAHAQLQARGLVATALGYSVRHEQALRRFLDDGRLRPDNNAAERALRIIAVGRKAWLFYGSDDHASAAGNILSLVASCKLHDLDAERYLAEIIRILPYWPRDRYLELAPKYWRDTRARLSPKELELPLGPMTVPPPKEQSSPN